MILSISDRELGVLVTENGGVDGGHRSKRAAAEAARGFALRPKRLSERAFDVLAGVSQVMFPGSTPTWVNVTFS